MKQQNTLNLQGLENPELSMRLKQGIQRTSKGEKLKILSNDPFIFRYVGAICKNTGQSWRAIRSEKGKHQLELRILH